MEDNLSCLQVHGIFTRIIDSVHIFYLKLEEPASEYKLPCFPSILSENLRFVEWKKKKPFSQILILRDNSGIEYQMKRTMLRISLEKDEILHNLSINDHIRNKYIESRIIDLIWSPYDDANKGFFGVSYIESESILVTEKIIKSNLGLTFYKLKRKNIDKLISMLLKIIELFVPSTTKKSKFSEPLLFLEEMTDNKNDSKMLEESINRRQNVFTMEVIIIKVGICCPEIYSFDKMNVSPSLLINNYINKINISKYLSYSIIFLLLEGLLPLGQNTYNFIETSKKEKITPSNYNTLIKKLIVKAIDKFQDTNTYNQINLLLTRGLSYDPNQRYDIEEIGKILNDLRTSTSFNLKLLKNPNYFSDQDYFENLNPNSIHNDLTKSKNKYSNSTQISNIYREENNKRNLYKLNGNIVDKNHTIKKFSIIEESKSHQSSLIRQFDTFYSEEFDSRIDKRQIF